MKRLMAVPPFIAKPSSAATEGSARITVHDLCRTGSTLLYEVAFNGDWIEKCLAHEEGRSSHWVYNTAE